jgi:hypothetical protein
VALAVDPLAHRRAAAERAGAELALAPEDLPAQVDVDVAFEFAGNDAAVEMTMQGTRRIVALWASRSSLARTRACGAGGRRSSSTSRPTARIATS